MDKNRTYRYVLLGEINRIDKQDSNNDYCTLYLYNDIGALIGYEAKFQFIVLDDLRVYISNKFNHLNKKENQIPEYIYSCFWSLNDKRCWNDLNQYILKTTKEI